MSEKDNDKDIESLSEKLAKPLEPPKNEDPEPKPAEDITIEERVGTMVDAAKEANSKQLAPVSVNDIDIMPATLRTSAQSSMSLRNVQSKLAEILTNENYLGLIAATNPEVLPSLLDSVTNAVSVSDNLLIQMARVSEKSSSMNKVFEYLTKQQEQKSKATKQAEDKGEFYDESIEKIKRSIYQRLDNERNEHHATSADFVNPEDDVIDADYEVSDESNDTDKA